MPPSDFSFLRAGVGSQLDETNEENEKAEMLEACAALLQVFSEDAIKTAGEYTIGDDRKEVTGLDMQRGLKYQARMFFQTVEDLDGRVDAAIEQFRNSDESGESGSEDSEDEEMEEADDGDIEVNEDELRRCVQMKRRVDAIVASWPSFQPTHPFLIMIKRAVDAIRVDED